MTNPSWQIARVMVAAEDGVLYVAHVREAVMTAEGWVITVDAPPIVTIEEKDGTALPKR